MPEANLRDHEGMAKLLRPAFTIHTARIFVSGPGWSPRTIVFPGGAPPTGADGSVPIVLARPSPRARASGDAAPHVFH